MLTPSDIRNRRFEKGMGGYKVDEVHGFLNEVADQYEDLLEDRQDLQKKLEILAEKVEQYREDEDSLRAALIGAQKLGDSVVRESKRKAEAIIAQATRQGEDLIAEAQQNIEKEALALNKMQMEVARFKTQILDLYKQHIQLIQEIPYDEAAVQQDASAPFVANIGETVEVSSAEPVAEVPESAPIAEPRLSFEPVPSEEDDEEEEVKLAFESIVEGTDSEEGEDAFPRRKSKFGTLRFGEAYDLTRKE